MAKRFSAVIGQPYGRYRNFVNICGIKIVSTGAICGSSALGCCGTDSSRLANCGYSQVNAAFSALPASLSIDWRAVMLNGSQLVEHGRDDDVVVGRQRRTRRARRCTRAATASTSSPTSTAPARARTAARTRWAPAPPAPAYAEVNSCGNPATTDGKWDMWIGYNQAGATGIQGTWSEQPLRRPTSTGRRRTR